MTQEIYDYLWIRNVLMGLDVQALASNIEHIEEYRFVLKCMADLLEHEPFPLVIPASLEKISDFIQIFRFKFRDEDISIKTNFIIEKLNQFKTMNPADKNLSIRLFYEQESKDRKLPFLYQNSKEVIDCLMQSDIHIYRDIMYHDNNTYIEPVPLTETDIIDYISLTNLIMTRYPSFFENENSIDKSINNLKQLVTIKALPLIIKSYIKKTLRRLEKANRKVKRLNF